MLVHDGGALEGDLGEDLNGPARHAAERARTEQRSLYLEDGDRALFAAPIHTTPLLLIFGAGHVGAALCHAAAAAGFRVHVADEREQLLTPDRLPTAHRLHDDLQDPDLPFGPQTWVMITTHDHALDQRLLERGLRQDHRWIGVIGSRRKAELTRQRLAHRGFAEDVIARVRIPVGIAIGAETPEEIAVSILAELIASRRQVSVTNQPRLERKARGS